MNKVIVLSRVSTVYQDVTQQTEAIMKQIHADGYSDDDVEIIENKESGSKLSFEEREGLTELMEKISANPEIYDAVYCFEISRLGRKPDVVFKVRDFLMKFGINLICTKPYFRMLEPDGKVSESSSIMFGLFAVMAESETRTRVERTQRGKAKCRAEKKWCGGWIKFGYSVNPENNKFYPNDDAETVKYIFNTYSDGVLSCNSIAKYLLETGKINHKNQQIAASFVQKVLLSKEYYNEKLYPAIISEELYNKCETLKPKRICKPKSYHKNIYYASGILYNKDGHLLTGYSSSGCYRNKLNEETVSINVADSILWEISKLHRISFSREKSEDTLRALIDDIAELEKKIDVAEKKIQENRQKQDKVEIRLIMGKISEQAATSLEEEIGRDTEQIKHVLESFRAELRLKNEEFKSFDMRDNRIVENLEAIQDDETRAKIVHEEIKKIIFERTARLDFNLWVTCFDETEPTCYNVHGFHNICSVAGVEFPYQKLWRYVRTRDRRKKN